MKIKMTINLFFSIDQGISKERIENFGSKGYMHASSPAWTTHPFESDREVGVTDTEKKLNGFVCDGFIWCVQTNLPDIVQSKQVTFLNNLYKAKQQI